MCTGCRSRLEGLIVPSKFYGIAAAGKPTIIVGDKDGELSRLVLKHACGAIIEPGDADALAELLRRLSKEPALLKEMGMRARQMLDAHFSRQKQLARWSALLDPLTM